MKNLFRAGIVLGLSMLISNPLAASAIEVSGAGENFHPQISDMDSRSMGFPYPGRGHVRIPPPVLVFQGSQFIAKDGTGAEIIELPASAPLAVIEYPEISLVTIDSDLDPTASVSFIVPPGYDESLKSVIGFKFLSGSSLVAGSISGNVSFTIQAEVLHADSTSEILTLGTTTTEDVKSAGPAIEGKISANQYSAKINIKIKDQFTAGDTVSLRLIRDNTDPANYEAPVYVPGLFLRYDIGRIKQVKGGANSNRTS